MDSRHKVLANRYDPEYFIARRNERIGVLDTGETDSWFQHPCTQILLDTLSADYCGIIMMWMGGAYSNEDSAEGTAQLVAKARGQGQAIEDIIELVYDLKANKLEEDDDST